jgi:hypothetical protein
VEKLLPVTFDASNQDWEPGSIEIAPVASQMTHPVWNIVADPAQNRRILEALPAFSGANRLATAKPAAAVLAAGEKGKGPLLAVAPYGKGRTMALAVPMSGRWSVQWGEGDDRYFAKFWRNVIYWLSERSSYGRRRLIASTDKTLYRPGETILVDAAAYDEAANPTADCRLALTVEPRASSSDNHSDYSPLRWPPELKRTGSDQGPLAAWSEELEMLRSADGKGFQLRLPVTDSALAVSAAPSIRLELSAYEGATLIDSNSIDVQILDDPPELQNPLPNPQLLAQLASSSGGQVLPDADTLATLIRSLPAKVGPPRTDKRPLWSTWWLWGLLLGLLTVEWFWRRRVGMA